jgi:O-antigen ligase
MDLSREPIARREPLPTTVLAMLAVAVGALAGGMVVVAGLPFAAIFAILPAVALVMLRSIWVGLAGVLVVIYVVPFAVVPIGGPITPTLLELALAYFLVAGVAIAALDRRVSLAIGWPEALVALLVGITVLAFLLGLGRNYTTQTVHDFGRFVLAIATFYLVRQLIRSPSDGRLLVVLLIVGSGIAAGIALILYAGGPFVTLRILGRLVPYGYPAADIVRYIEDNPARAMRATGTSVDPNAFGGMMMVGFLLAMTQTLTPSRAIPGWLAGSVTALTGAALLLTYSRGAWVGAAFGVGFVLLFRRRWLIAPLGLMAAAVITLGFGGGFVNRLWQGFTAQDPATKLRLREYQNAWDIIRRHPWIGVGFGDAPSVNQQTGVSSVYLLIGERIGVIGLSVFLIIVAVVAWRGLRGVVGRRGPDVDVLLGLEAAFLALLAVAFVDHYFFNPQFSHTVALFWIVAGGIIALESLAATRPADDGVSSESG